MIGKSKPIDAFTYLVDKGLFRIGVQLTLSELSDGQLDAP